ncbi:DUF4062 domain-containing protein [Lactococcus lactis]|uniref:DUF4062 domain-containing protein n=1 Tax=Lactococcus lactis TaxID=1358 RepID=UPI001F0EB270|nr:DUF4062 domain-containing protein [Lactococcus lactis]MCH5430828.1 DUF4062 domain-containing protein [Lactococcus lactis]
MEKKYQVFISSTYTDLIEERQKAVEAILSAGHIPAGMELFHAGDETQKELISEWIEDSDIYVLILGGRYGSLDSDGMGYTHWEYEKAKELGKPIFSLILTEDYLNKKVEDKKLKATDLSYKDDKLVAFRDEVMFKIVSNIDNINQIEAEVIKSINRIVKKRENDLEGWIKGSSLNELEALREENKELYSELRSRQSEVIDLHKEAKDVRDDFIGTLSFKYVKEQLSQTFLDINDVEDTIQYLEKKAEEDEQSGWGSSNSSKVEITKLKKLKIENKSALEKLMEIKDTLNMEGLYVRNRPSIILFNKYYLSKWIELSLIEPKQGDTERYERYIWNDNGKKFINMINMENLNK